MANVFFGCPHCQETSAREVTLGPQGEWSAATQPTVQHDFAEADFTVRDPRKQHKYLCLGCMEMYAEPKMFETTPPDPGSDDHDRHA